MKIEMPEYLKDEYKIQQGEHLQCLDSLLAWYWTNWSILKENLQAEGMNPSLFIERIKQCKTMDEMKSMVNPHI